MTAMFAPGDLVYARGREWVALPSPDDTTLCLRPLSGAEVDVQWIHPALEREPVRPARFSLPTADETATQDGARLLSEALRLSLRRGAGPFRSAARLGFEPRAYQLVPLLMALRLAVVRLLIADDVGIGKTIEAGLILRELIDRGEASRFAVLCPPHLVEQWTGELKAKFDLDAVAVTAASAARLERGLPASQTLFDAHPYTVVSLDYIKAERRRDSFARSCPALVVVDEAHACVGTHQSRQQRFELLKRLASDTERHLILLTATPHSGDESLAKMADPKLEAVAKVLKPLIVEGANPVVFCRFIASANHVADALRKTFSKLRIEAVTGELTPEERRARVEAMAEADQRLLVATDCLSEGINLQNLFDTVIHYDLSWNPTRHQQREGRVDRFGQPAKLVRSVLLYSPDSAIDGAVLDVILRKAERIRKATGVTVPLPDERGAVTGALMNAVLLRKGRSQQLSLDFGLAADTEAMETRWRDAEEGERRSRARFAQNTIKPEEVIPEWQRWRDLLGSPDQVRRFIERAMSRLDAALEPDKNGAVRAHISALPAAVRERLAARGFEGTVKIAFEEPPPSGAEMVARSHPLPATLAEMLFEGALDPGSSPVPSLGRAGAWPTPAVKTVTTVALLRLRYKLMVHGRSQRMLLAEEAATFAWDSSQTQTVLAPEAARTLLDQSASADLVLAARQRLIAKAIEQISSMLNGPIATYARQRAQALAEDHARVRAAAAGSARVTVEPVLPPDVIGLFVLVPAVH
jgi:superfamily II DNA or RNA helicase